MNTILWICAWFIGILLGEWLGGAWWMWLILGSMATAVSFYASRTGFWWAILGWLAVGIFFGGARHQAAVPTLSADDLSYYNEIESVTVTGLIIKEPELRATTQELVLRVESLSATGAASTEVSGQLLVTLPRYPTYVYGTELTLVGDLAAPESSTEFDYAAYLGRKGIYSVMFRPRVISFEPDQGRWWWHTLFAVKGRASQTIDTLLPAPQSGLLSGILLGTQNALPAEIDADFRATGITHIVVISGFNISIIAAIFLGLFTPLLGKRQAAYAAIAGIFIYTFLVGGDAAVMRAAIMGTLYVISERLLGQKTFAIASLFVAGFFMTLVNPNTLWDVGFQLSFAATLSLMLYADGMTNGAKAWLGRHLTQRWTKAILNIINEAVLITIAAQILTLPLLLFYFQQFSIISLLANAFILPAQPGVMFWGGSATLIGMISPLLARPIMAIADVHLWYTIEMSRLFASVPFAIIEIPFSMEGLLIIYGIIGVWTWYGAQEMERKIEIRQRIGRHLPARVIFTVLLIGLVWLWRWSASQPDGLLHIHIIGVDGVPVTLVQTPTGRAILFDGGRSPNDLTRLLGDHLPLQSRQIDLLIITEDNPYRIGALPALIGRYSIKQILLPAPTANPSDPFSILLDTLPPDIQHPVSNHQTLEFEKELSITQHEVTDGFDTTTVYFLRYGAFTMQIGERTLEAPAQVSVTPWFEPPTAGVHLSVIDETQPDQSPKAPTLNLAHFQTITIETDGRTMHWEGTRVRN